MQTNDPILQPFTIKGVEFRNRMMNTAHAKADDVEPEEVRRMYVIGTSMQCFVNPEEIVHAICFLTSDFAKHVSGQILAIDGHTETLYPRL